MSTTRQPSATPAPSPAESASSGSTSGVEPGRKRAYKARLPGTERRAVVLAVALRAFAQHGYELTSMATIAAAADITRPVLYHYFPSKQALYLAVLDDQSATMGEFIANRVAAQPDYAHRLRAAADAYLGFAEEHPQAWALLLDDSALGDPECAAGRRRIRETLTEAALDLIAPDIADSGHSIASPEIQLGMRFVLSGLNGVIQWRREHPELTRPQVLSALTHLIQNLSTLPTS